MSPAASRAGRRFGLIGCGRIGADVLAAWRAGALAGWQLDSVLVRRPRMAPPAEPGAVAMPPVLHDAATFLRRNVDLIVECAGPAALAAHGAAALAAADVWTTSGSALADPVVEARLAAAALASGRRLRLLSGAIAGLDGVAALAIDPDLTLEIEVDLPPAGCHASSPVPGDRPGEATMPADASSPRVVAEGTVRAVAARYPDCVNVAVAAALAGPGLDRSVLRLLAPPPGRHRIALRARGRSGSLAVEVNPLLQAGACHPVAASIVAALRQT